MMTRSLCRFSGDYFYHKIDLTSELKKKQIWKREQNKVRKKYIYALENMITDSKNSLCDHPSTISSSSTSSLSEITPYQKL